MPVIHRLSRSEVFRLHVRDMFIDKRPNISEKKWEDLWSFLNMAFSEYAFRSAATYYRCLYSGTPITSDWTRKGKKNYETIMRTVLKHRRGENISDLDLTGEPIKEERIEECQEE
jgi:hypothetical protein